MNPVGHRPFYFSLLMEITGHHSTRGQRLSGKTNTSHWFHGGHSMRQDRQNARVRVSQKQPSEPGSISSSGD